MRLPPARIEVAELLDPDKRKSFFSLPVRAYIPVEPRLNVIATALMVPESVGLLVGPACCLHHLCFSPREQGVKHRLYLLELSQQEILMGKHIERVREAASRLVLQASPKALFLFTTCLDYLLGSDFERMAKQLEGWLGLPVRAVRVGALCNEGRLPSKLAVYSAIYSLLPRHKGKEKAINLLGASTPVSVESEIYPLLAQKGYVVRQVAACSSFEEFLDMGKASYNILIKPEARLWAEKMNMEEGTPYCMAYASYSLSVIRGNYSKIEKLLGVTLDTELYERQTKIQAEPLLERVSREKIAVGSCLNGRPFDIARGLMEMGMDIRALFVQALPEEEEEHMRWIAARKPRLPVYRYMHPELPSLGEEWKEITLALGFDAGYFCKGAKTVNLPPERQGYGYQNVIYLLEEAAKALAEKVSHREILYTRFSLAEKEVLGK